MEESLKSGFAFGITTGVITTLGLIVGLNSGTHSSLAVLGGIISIAISDGLAEAAGMHISKESENKGRKYVWQSTLATLAAKGITTLSFAIPVLLLKLSDAVILDVIWGLLLIVGLSYALPGAKNTPKAKDIAQHLLFAFAVIVAAYFMGLWVNAHFK